MSANNDLPQRLLEYCKYDTLAMLRLVEFLGQGD
jgi:hypothetical protein